MEVEHLPKREDRDEQPRFYEPPQKRHRTKAPVQVQRAGGASSSPIEQISDEEDPLLFQDKEEGLHHSYWQQEDAAVEIALPLPTARHGWMRMARDPQAYIVNTLKKKSVEVYEKNMDEDTKAKFRKAKDTEINKFIQSEALEALPPHLQPDRNKAMAIRWLLSWKVDGEGATVPKARLVILGYQDPKYEHRITYAPTTTRHTRQLMLQQAANRGWTCWEGDVAAAFLQGRECSEEMFCIPTEDLCERMGIPKESVTRLRRSCYGLVQAPYEWYESVRAHFLSLGFRQSFADPCCWILQKGDQVHAIVAGHVDDFLFVGDASDDVWMRAKKSIQEKFRWGEFEEKRFTQCGVQIEQHADYSFSLNQEKYMSHTIPIPLTAERRKQRKEETTEKEKKALRGVLGALSWHCSQVGYRFSAYVSLHLSEVPSSTVETIVQVNALIHKIQDAAKEPLRIFPIKPDRVSFYAWCDASNQNRSSGHSTKGIFCGAADKGLSSGNLAKITPLFWQSSKIGRVCRAPGASEAHAAIDAEDILFLLRFQWSEMEGHVPHVRDPDGLAKLTPGTLITDSRSVYDKLQRPYISPTGESKKIDIELLALKNAQKETGLEIRWVNSQAMLANSLTKRGEDEQMNRFIACKQTWRIVEDADMFSGKRLKKEQRDLLKLSE